MALMRIGRGWAVAVTLAILAATINAPTAAADDKLLFGGGLASSFAAATAP